MSKIMRSYQRKRKGKRKRGYAVDKGTRKLANFARIYISLFLFTNIVKFRFSKYKEKIGILYADYARVKYCDDI